MATAAAPHGNSRPHTCLRPFIMLPMAVKEAVELAVIGRQLTATSDFNPATHIAVGVDPGVTQAIKAAHAQRDPATGQEPVNEGFYKKT
ncbi:hypothetical protein HaLaN_01296 [Haematococcus lacustris]|uniref:Uncharacterized protein n=1 Tax=Haematococcus lacustris TaxID=44745 RepID=A0A699YUD0_HAELA|nr:hypothetical protein HaLaN_01296 [Haematococcus lacustris]